MSWFFEGNGLFDSSTVSNTIVTTSSIGNSRIDMASNTITSVHDPVNPQDAATKNYVDSLNIKISNYTVSGTQSQISNVLYGSYIITVTSTNGGPCATYAISKNVSGSYPNIFRMTLSPGGDGSTLNIMWPPGQGIFLTKSTSNYSGTYIVKIM